MRQLLPIECGVKGTHESPKRLSKMAANESLTIRWNDGYCVEKKAVRPSGIIASVLHCAHGRCFLVLGLTIPETLLATADEIIE
jgi:hypothetical protein